MSILINIEDLLSGQLVEGTRMEFKKGWNPKPIMRSVCAFANDFENEGSGYIIIGVEEVDGKPLRPVLGFNPDELEKVEKEIIGYGNQIKPSYLPRLSLEAIDNKHVLVIWTPAGSNRPYKVPDDVSAKHKTYNYRIRYRSNSIVPNQEQEIELLQLTAQVPFDDRPNTKASIEDLSHQLMRKHLKATNSKLYQESKEIEIIELAEKMNLSQGAKEHLFPKNIGLLMFSKDTQKYFPSAIIEVVNYPYGLAGKQFEEKAYTGTIQQQLLDVLDYFKTVIIRKRVIKHKHKEQADVVYNYPYDAIEEALSNAVYHRNYELLDPIEVRILPNVIEIISFNGVDASIKQKDFDKGRVRARRYRNRRVGEFLKELRLTEGRGTGVPTIIKALKDNDSPEAIFDTNEPERISFIVEIPIHPLFEGEVYDQGENLSDQGKEVNDQVSDQDKKMTDQDADQDNRFVSKGFEELEEIINKNKNEFSDQDTDQDADQDEIAFDDRYKELLKSIKMVFGKERIPDNKVISKYKASALAISKEQLDILKFALNVKSNKEIQEEALKLKTHTDNFKNHIEPLLVKGFLRRTLPNKPTSKYQKYYTTKRGEAVIYIREQLIKTN
jgi:ATP-dependent DNA helicase RecG